MSAAYDWASGIVSPERASAQTPQMSKGGGSQSAMQSYQRDPSHYQAGTGMSAPLQGLADRGQARGDLAQQHLNSYGSGAGSYGGMANAYGGKGYSAGLAGQNIGTIANRDAMATGQQLSQIGGQGGALGNQYANTLSGTAGKAGGIAAGGQGMAGSSYGSMTGAADRLANLESVQGPSAAQAQLAQATGRGQLANLAMARSGSGFGGSAARSSQAMRQNAAMGQEAANQSAILKAGEDAAWRQRQAANTGAAGGLYGNAGQLGLQSGQLGLAGNAQALQGQQAAGQMALAGNQAQMQGVQAGGQMGLAGAQAGLAGTAQGMQGSQLGIQGAQAGIQGTQVGGQLAAAGYGMGFQGDQQAGQAIAQDQAAKQAYEQMLTQQMGIQAGVSVGNAQASNAFTGSMLGAGASALPLLMMSDAGQKNIGPEVKMSSALYGNPYGRRGAPGHMGELAPGSEDYYGHDEVASPVDARSQISPQQKRSMAAGAAASMMGSMSSGMGRADYDFMSPGGEAYQPRGGFGSYDLMSDEDNKRAPDLRGVKSHLYEYKDPNMPGAEPGLQAGPMAGDIQRAIPGAVKDTPYGKMVDADRTVLPLLSAVGEQQEEIDRLKRILDIENEGRLAENSHLPKGRRVA